jgi:hypothetical protein
MEGRKEKEEEIINIAFLTVSFLYLVHNDFQQLKVLKFHYCLSYPVSAHNRNCGRNIVVLVALAFATSHCNCNVIFHRVNIPMNRPLHHTNLAFIIAASKVPLL